MYKSGCTFSPTSVCFVFKFQALRERVLIGPKITARSFRMILLRVASNVTGEEKKSHLIRSEIEPPTTHMLTQHSTTCTVL